MIAILTAAEAELELMQAQLDAENKEYCTANPEECDDENAVLSGPARDSENCAQKYFSAGVAIAASVAVVVTAKSIASWATIGYIGAMALGGVGAIAVGVTATIVIAAYACYKAQPPTLRLLPAKPAYY